jgi:hypothetical protein
MNSSFDMIASATREEAGAERVQLYRGVTPGCQLDPAGVSFLTDSASRVVAAPASPAVPRGTSSAPATPCIWSIGSLRRLLERPDPSGRDAS